MRQALALILTLVAAACAPSLGPPTRPSAPPPTSAPVEPAPPLVSGDPLARLVVERFTVERLSLNPPVEAYGPVFTLKETSGLHAAMLESVDFVMGSNGETYRNTGCIRPSRVEPGASWESKKGLYPYCIDGLSGSADTARIQVWYRDDEGRRGLVVGDWRREAPTPP
jgi:hypothetical protein